MKTELKNLREKHSQKIIDVANFLELNRDTYSNYEIDISNMKMKNFLRLCELYKVTPNYILNYEQETQFTPEELIQIKKALDIIERKTNK